MKNCNLEMVAANGIGKGGIGTEENDIYILRKGAEDLKHVGGKKQIIAEEIVHELADIFSVCGITRLVVECEVCDRLG